MADASLDIAELLGSMGYDTPATVALARTALEAAQLTRAGKSRIDSAKRERVQELLAATFHVTCGGAECARSAGGREIVVATGPNACSICGGSANRRWFVAAERAFADKNLRRVVVVGGAPAVHEELVRLKPAAWELRIVPGTDRRTLDQARHDARWADVVLLWGGTELDHKVSQLYARETPRERLVHLSRRGIAALLEEAVKHANRR